MLSAKLEQEQKGENHIFMNKTNYLVLIECSFHIKLDCEVY